MSKKIHKKGYKQRRLASQYGTMYPYLPQDLDHLTVAQKVMLSPEVPEAFRDALQEAMCIDIQDVISAFFYHQDLLPEMNLSPLYTNSFLYAQAPAYVYDRETGEKDAWGHQEVRWGTHCVSVKLPYDSYLLAQGLMKLPEEQPQWFEQAHWMLNLSLFLEVPEGKRRRCVGPVAVGHVLIDAAGTIVRNEYGVDQFICRIVHDKIEEVIYWCSGEQAALGPAPEAGKVVSTFLAEHFSHNIYLSLLGYAFLNTPHIRLLPKEIHQLATVNYIREQDGCAHTQNLHLSGEQYALKLLTLPVDDAHVHALFGPRSE